MKTLISLLDIAERERLDRLNESITNRQSFVAWANLQLIGHTWNLRKDPNLTGSLYVNDTSTGLVVVSDNPRLQEEASWLLYNMTFGDNDQRWVFTKNAAHYQLSTEDSCSLMQAITAQLNADKVAADERTRDSLTFKRDIQKKTAALVEKMNKELKTQRFRQWKSPDGSKSNPVRLTVEDAEHSIYLYAGKSYVAREDTLYGEQYIYTTFAKALDQAKIYRDHRGETVGD